MLWLDGMGKGQGSQDERQDHHGGLGDHQKHPARQAVSNQTTIKGKQQRRSATNESDQPEVKGRTGNLINQVSLGGTLHPGADQRNHLTAKP